MSSPPVSNATPFPTNATFGVDCDGFVGPVHLMSTKRGALMQRYNDISADSASLLLDLKVSMGFWFSVLPLCVVPMAEFDHGELNPNLLR